MTRYKSSIDGTIQERTAMWDWIPPSTPYAAETWLANGFLQWRSTPPQEAE